MTKKVDGWLVPVGSFIMAAAVAYFAGPASRALGHRAQQDVTCCHGLSKTVPIPAFTNVVPPEEAAGAFMVHIQVHANGNMFIKASAVNAHVVVKNITRDADYELNLTNKTDSCIHTARVGSSMATAFDFKLTGTKNFIPSGFGIGKGDIKTEAKSVFLTDLTGGPRKNNTGLRLDLDEEKSTGVEFELGKEGFKLKTEFKLENGVDKDDTSFESFEDSNMFHLFAKLTIHTETKMNIAGIADFAGADGECSITIKNPFLRDVEEDVFINFLDPVNAPDTATFRERCSEAPASKEFQDTKESDDALIDGVKAQIPKNRPK